MSSWFSGAVADAAYSSAKVYTFDLICGGMATVYWYYFWWAAKDEVIAPSTVGPWRILFGFVLAGVQAGAIPIFTTLRPLAYFSAFFTAAIRYLYIALYFWSMFVAFFLCGLIVNISEWQENSDKIVWASHDEIFAGKCTSGPDPMNSARSICEGVRRRENEAQRNWNGNTEFVLGIQVLGHLITAYLSFGFAAEYEPETDKNNEYDNYFTADSD
jgi:hypothetical protein